MTDVVVMTGFVSYSGDEWLCELYSGDDWLSEMKW